jgi:hypothetical protein
MFITSSGYEEAIRTILQERGAALMAIAFWGHGAEQLLKDRRDTTRIICNLSSGATNPDTIVALRRAGNIRIKQHDRLHAKVVSVGTTAIVGSANLSSNGLNLEADEVMGWEEAGYVTRSAGEVQAIGSWFEALWSKSRDVTDHDITEAKARWKLRRANRVTPSAPDGDRGQFDLLSLKAADLADRDVVLAIYRNWLSEEAKKAYRARQKELTGQKMSSSARLPPMFEGWPSLPKDAQIIDVYFGKRLVTCYGVFKRTLDIRFKYKDGSSGHLAVCRKETKLLGRTFVSKSFADTVRPHINAIWNSSKAVGDEDAKVISLRHVAPLCG